MHTQFQETTSGKPPADPFTISLEIIPYTMIFLPASPASYTHNFSLGLTNFICESLNSQKNSRNLL